MLRAYAKYLRQIGMTFSQSYIEATLAAHPAIADAARRLFEPASIPSRQSEPASGEPSASGRRAREADLDAVASLDEDRILRSFLASMRGHGAHERLPPRPRTGARAGG